MRFLISVIDDKAASGTADEMAAIDLFNSDLRDAGYWEIAVGIASPQEALSIDNRADAELITPGSTLYGTEYMSGFWIIDVPNQEIATQLATKGSKACNRKVELRPLLG